jgi:lysophospholipase L1-like esterase
MTFIETLGRHTRRGLVALGVAATLAACGGGTSRIDPFVAARVFALGDETSVLTSDGRKYSVNALTDTGALDCRAQPIWVQAVANNYGFVFAECNPDAVADPKAIMKAAPGAKIGDLAAQIDGVVAALVPGEETLATLMIGANDVWELYDRFDQDPSLATADLLAQAQSRGAQIAVQLKKLADAGVPVVVSTVYDLSKTPYALAEKAAHTDTDRAKLIYDLTFELNAGMRVELERQGLNDGRYIGLVLADEMVQAEVKSPVSFSLINVTEAVCLTTAPLPDCSSATLVADGKSSSFLWSDDRHLAYGGQQRLGLLAVARASNNPF